MWCVGGCCATGEVTALPFLPTATAAGKINKTTKKNKKALVYTCTCTCTCMYVKNVMENRHLNTSHMTFITDHMIFRHRSHDTLIIVT